MNPFPQDVFTEPSDVDPDTLANLGPLKRLAGRWEAEKGIDINPKATLMVHGRPEPFDHHDQNTLKRVAPAKPNPLMQILAERKKHSNG